MSKTIVLRKIRKNYGDYDYLEIDVEAKEYVSGNSGSHMGHGITLLRVDVASSEKLREKERELVNQKFTEIKTFHPAIRED